MKRIYVLFIGLSSLFLSCSDEFNDPNPDNQPIIDNTLPQMEIFSPLADSIYRGMDTIPVKVRFSDDYFLGNIQFIMNTVNVGSSGMNIALQTNDSVFVLDTFYLVPQFDTLQMNVIAKVKDYANNGTDSIYNFTIYK